MSKAKLIAAVLAATAFSGAANAAVNFSFQNLSGAEYDTAGVYVKGDVVFDGVDDDGTGFDLVRFRLWDDGNVKFQADYSGVIGSTNIFHFEVYYPGLVGTSARGVGLYLYELPGDSLAKFIDPYDVPHYSDPGQCQRDCGPPAVPESSTWAMMIAGFGMAGVALRSRRQRVKLGFA